MDNASELLIAFMLSEITISAIQIQLWDIIVDTELGPTFAGSHGDFVYLRRLAKPALISWHAYLMASLMLENIHMA